MMVTKRIAAFAALVTTLGLQSANAVPNLLTNGSFEAVDASAPPYFIRSFQSTPGWTQVLDGVDLTHDLYTQGPAVLVQASDGVQYLDMNQANPIGGLYQIVPATPGVTYTMQLDTCAWATNAIGGTIGYQLIDPATQTVLADGSYTDNVGGTWITRSLAAAATSGSIEVYIFGIRATQAGMGLDNVRLTAVPEPTASGVLLAGAGLLLRRRRA